MLLLGGVVVVLVEVAEVLIYLNDKRKARNHPDPYAGLCRRRARPARDDRVRADRETRRQLRRQRSPPAAQPHAYQVRSKSHTLEA